MKELLVLLRSSKSSFDWNFVKGFGLCEQTLKKTCKQQGEFTSENHENDLSFTQKYVLEHSGCSQNVGLRLGVLGHLSPKFWLLSKALTKLRQAVQELRSGSLFMSAISDSGFSRTPDSW